MATKNKVIALERGEILPHTVLQQIRQKGLASGLSEVIPFASKDIEVARWVNLKCRYGCNRYNTSWCCPPATPGTDEAREILSEYTAALLLVGNQRCPEFYLNNAKKRVKQVRIWKGAVALERMLFLEGYYKAFSLVSENCGLCKECTYPKACRFPQEKRPSVESFSIDMMGTLRNLDIKPRIATQTNQSFQYYGIILVA